MSRITAQRNNGELWLMTCCSVAVHLTVFFFLLNFQLSSRLKEAPVYYVDLLNLPVASPQAGSSAASESTPAPPQPPVSPSREMTLPAKPIAVPVKLPAPVKPTVAKPTPPPDTAASARDFEEHMARLERAADARHEAAALDALRKKKSGGPVGIAGAAGNEAGSDYASYIRSRLEDAFRKVDTFKPLPGKEVWVRLTIDEAGKISNQRYEQRSNDPLFNDAVTRAIARAEKDFKRPPGGGKFETVFVFKPQGVGKK